jgi:hypothetical protein
LSKCNQVYSDYESNFTYKNGKPISISLSVHPGSVGFREGKPPLEFAISRNAEGPFMKFPASREDIVKHFGEPDEWTWYSLPKGP